MTRVGAVLVFLTVLFVSAAIYAGEQPASHIFMSGDRYKPTDDVVGGGEKPVIWGTVEYGISIIHCDICEKDKTCSDFWNISDVNICPSCSHIIVRNLGKMILKNKEWIIKGGDTCESKIDNGQSE